MRYRPHGYDVRTFLIYIDSYENEVPVGQFYHPCRDEVGTFRSLTQLLLRLDQSLDIDNIPQSFSSVRTFCPLSSYWENEVLGVRPYAGKIATFAVRVLFRRNASWQGSVTWLNEGRTQSFRSVLELVYLINSALAGDRVADGVSIPDYQKLQIAE